MNTTAKTPHVSFADYSRTQAEFESDRESHDQIMCRWLFVVTVIVGIGFIGAISLAGMAGAL